MKTKYLQILSIFLLIGFNLSAQNSYQTFASAGFKIKCACNLYINSTFIKLANQTGSKDIIAAYICAENEDSPELGIIYNINIYNESKSYAKIPPARYAYFEKKYLEAYAANLSNAGIPFSYTIYQGVTALEYSFDQQGLPTKAIMFLKNKKSYLLQVGTRNGLTTKFNLLKTSFVLL
jgi:hypothetical protein